jgi:hypothetical protein
MTAIRTLLSMLALLGLILAPLARPAMAVVVDMPAGISDQAVMPGAEDMPCCPDMDHVADCGKDCLSMASCMVGTVLNLPTMVTLAVPYRLASLVSAGDDANVAGLMYGPPPRPPKI